jgi:hypothetical protein
MVDEQCLLVVTLSCLFLVEGEVVEVGRARKSPTVEKDSPTLAYSLHHGPMIPGLAEAYDGGFALAVAAVERGPHIGEIIFNRRERLMMRRLAPDHFALVNMLGPGLRRVEQAQNAGNLRAIVNDLRKKIGNAFAQRLEQLCVQFFRMIEQQFAGVQHGIDGAHAVDVALMFRLQCLFDHHDRHPADDLGLEIGSIGLFWQSGDGERRGAGCLRCGGVIGSSRVNCSSVSTQLMHRTFSRHIRR